MFLSKGAKAFGSCSQLSSISAIRSSTSLVDSHLCDALRRPRCLLPRNGSKRGYAAVSDAEEATDSEQPSGRPISWPQCVRPTPYEIFDLKPEAPYSKSKYYQLAKQYHPDRYTDQGEDKDENGLTRATKLERYRLVVAANEILGNPVKKREYDQFGLGWDMGKPRDINEELRAKDRAWRTAPNSPAMNSSWQDWERWRQRRDGTEPKQQPIFMSNGGFVIVLCACVVVFIWVQASQASQRSGRVMQARDRMHQITTNELHHGRMQRATLNQDGRVKLFLHKREFGDNPFEPVGHLPPEATRR